MSELETMPAAVLTASEAWSGSELLDRAAGATRLLGRIGPPGQPNPALLGSGPTGYAVCLGGAFSNHPIAPLGTRMAAAELAPVVRDLGSSFLLAERQFDELAQQVANAAGCTPVIIEEIEPAATDFQPTAPDSVVLVLHTSGTTGRPKPVYVRDAAAFARSRVYQSELGLEPGERYCSTGGFHHTGGVGMCFVGWSPGPLKSSNPASTAGSAPGTSARSRTATCT